MALLLSFLLPSAAATSWRVCDVTEAGFDAVGDGVAVDSASIREALVQCDEVIIPAGKSFLTGPQNLSSNQVLRVDGTLLASTDPADYPLIAPLMGYGWGDDMNCA
jgi:polygalacturonase